MDDILSKYSFGSLEYTNAWHILHKYDELLDSNWDRCEKSRCKERADFNGSS